MIYRAISSEILAASGKMPVISITGPRQSGKTTLVKSIFKNHNYFSLEDPEIRHYASSDPKRFLSSSDTGIIIDEAQYVPELFSYIQIAADEQNKNGRFIITGSQNFLMMEKISQSLAGRVSLFNLLPFTYSEVKSSQIGRKDIDDILFTGFYPRIYNEKLEPEKWYPSYIRTYLERDVRQVANIGNLNSFHRFLMLCAGRTGQLVNFSSMGSDLGVSYQTIKSWLSILEESYIVFLLYPFHKNFNKRIIKAPKLYFYDTGLVCSLMNIKSPQQVKMHYIRGPLFETFVIAELMKAFFNRGEQPPLYFWRDSTGNEIDCILEIPAGYKAIEIKSGFTIHSDFFKGIEFFRKTAGKKNVQSFLIYGGKEKQMRSVATVLGWRDLSTLSEL